MEDKRVSYTAAQKRAIMNYRARNPEQTRCSNKEYYERSKLNPDFVANKNAKAKIYYYTKKLLIQKPI